MLAIRIVASEELDLEFSRGVWSAVVEDKFCSQVLEFRDIDRLGECERDVLWAIGN